MKLNLGHHIDAGALADCILEALRAADYDIIKVGTVPPWMEKVSDLLPCGTVWRMKSHG